MSDILFNFVEARGFPTVRDNTVVGHTPVIPVHHAAIDLPRRKVALLKESHRKFLTRV